MAATVPITVDTPVAIRATSTVYQMLCSISRFSSISWYHRRENPEKEIMLLLSLKENSIR